MDKELQYHIERRISDLVNDGVDPREAARRVRIEFGGSDQIKEECRDARATRWLEDFIQDFRYALRTLVAIKTFSILAVLALALGIGANTADKQFKRRGFRIDPKLSPTAFRS